MSVRLVSEQAEALAQRVAGVRDALGAMTVARTRLLALEFAKMGAEGRLSPAQVAAVRQLLAHCTEQLALLVREHRDIHALVSRLGKSIDRNFVADISPAAPRDDDFAAARRRPLVDESVALHLYARGHADVADTLVKEAGVRVPDRATELLEFHRVVKELEQRNAYPALAWLHGRADDPKIFSESLFKLHRLIFRQITNTEGQIAGIKYAQEYFPQFASKHEQDLQRTMCLLVYESGLLPECYIALNDEILWDDCLDTFLKDASSILHFPSTSPIETVIDIGTTVIPTLLEIHDRLALTHGTHTWKNKEELPIEMVNRNHSFFSCPILRQQSTEDNPPIKLLCGHIISKDAFDKLVRNMRLKCPYCPFDQKRSDAKVVYF